MGLEMNERIKELAEQAKMFATPMKFHLGGQDYARVRDEKFAELIIKECKYVILDMMNKKQGDFNTLDLSLTEINEHFGVEDDEI